ncbi:MAG: hypothetical protein KKE12_01270, partial [Proteobacteria bacterium]|nr:hypothetical protein [Pseudomonadota bacterium]
TSRQKSPGRKVEHLKPKTCNPKPTIQDPQSRTQHPITMGKGIISAAGYASDEQAGKGTLQQPWEKTVPAGKNGT